MLRADPKAILLAVGLLFGASATAFGAAASAVAKVFDVTRLHRIEITLAPADVDRIQQHLETRLRCTISFDGTVLKDVGIRQSGGPYHPYVPLSRKPTFSIKFDEFVKGQDLFGLEKLVLKNGLQDTSWVNEHMTYEVFRRAGLAAPMTAHAHVIANGIDLGLYVMREPVNKQFLTRNFGKDDNDGNLYEIGASRAFIDFVDSPRSPALKDEVKDGRKRDDLFRLAAIVSTVPAENLEAALAGSVDLDRLAAFLAAEFATAHFDGFAARNNNTFMYASEKDGKFRWIPYGADQAFGGAMGMGPGMRIGPSQQAFSQIAQRMQAVPALRKRYVAELDRIGGAKVWDKAALHARLEQVGRILATAPMTPQLAADIARFANYRASVEQFIDSGSPVASRTPLSPQ